MSLLWEGVCSDEYDTKVELANNRIWISQDDENYEKSESLVLLEKEEAIDIAATILSELAPELKDVLAKYKVVD